MSYGHIHGKQSGRRRSRFVSRLLAALTVQVIEDSGDDVGIFNARNESDGTPALLADFNIDAEADDPRNRLALLRVVFLQPKSCF